MRAVEFNAKIENDRIVIPEKYKDELPARVKVILLSDDDTRRRLSLDDFDDIAIETKGYIFNRDEANAR